MARADARLKPAKAARIGQAIASLDIGSSKITCLIGRYDPSSRAGFTFLGGGRQQSQLRAVRGHLLLQGRHLALQLSDGCQVSRARLPAQRE